MKRPTYENDIPVDDELTVLDLLYSRWGDQTTRHISLWPHAPPHVEIGYHHDFADSRYRRFLVTDRVVQSLRQTGRVSGKPQWGRCEEREQHINGDGIALLASVRTEFKLDWDRLRSEDWLERQLPWP